MKILIGLKGKSQVRNDDNITYILISVIVIMLLVRYIRNDNTFIKRSSKIVLSFAIAGATSNLIDRLWKGYVITYIEISNFSKFNLAYVYIVITWIGMAGILTKYTMDRISEFKRSSIKKKTNNNKVDLNNEKDNNSKRR